MPSKRAKEGGPAKLSTVFEYQSLQKSSIFAVMLCNWQ